VATVESTEPMQAPVAETMERNIREQLAHALGPGGFDPARDITAITVNRWPHRYAYEYNSLWDKFWLEGGETPRARHSAAWQSPMPMPALTRIRIALSIRLTARCRR